MNDPNNQQDEQLTDEQLIELVLEAQQQAHTEQHQPKHSHKQSFLKKFIIWTISLTLLFNTFAIIFQIYSIPAIEFLQASAKLSSQENIQAYKKAVVEIETASSKGTGFIISNDGFIVTNHHVIDNANSLTVVVPDVGLYRANIVESFPDVDLAILRIEVKGAKLPYLRLATTQPTANTHVTFIGNPLYFTGIANEGTLLEETMVKDITGPVMMMKAPVYRGNSGSPVLNETGEVIGVVFATTEDTTYGKVGLYIPIQSLQSRFSITKVQNK